MSNPKRHGDSGGSDLCYGLHDLGTQILTSAEKAAAEAYVRKVAATPQDADLFLEMLGLVEPAEEEGAA